ncbi:MAG: 2-C-methyl-D-erythritol 2,4-cyclodiphosphate synthase [Deltaproteobacteria bacterium]|nr:2-C-methyl-D-erythritol 2,4-cyclodiphosphate synthase [Deltaproteobacteria bacterium]
MSDFRIGTGFDVHALVQGRRLIIGGVDIEYPLGLMGHSDADVLLHAICDALLGALCLGDLGKHFPPDDPRWSGADSSILLSQTMEMVRARGWHLANLDSTIIAQRPKLSPHIPDMRANLARLTGLEQDRVSVKATTTEGLGFTGRGEGIAAQAAVLLTR